MDKQLATIKDVQDFIQSDPYNLLFVAGHTCSVCHALKPQVEQLLKGFPAIRSAMAYIEDIPELAGEFLIFTVPVVILFKNGKRVDSMARFVPLGELEKKMTMLVGN